MYETTDSLVFYRQIHAKMGIVHGVSNWKLFNGESKLNAPTKFKIL